MTPDFPFQRHAERLEQINRVEIAEDGFAPARGIYHGVILSVILWMLGLGVWLCVRSW